MCRKLFLNDRKAVAPTVIYESLAERDLKLSVRPTNPYPIETRLSVTMLSTTIYSYSCVQKAATSMKEAVSMEAVEASPSSVMETSTAHGSFHLLAWNFPSICSKSNTPVPLLSVQASTYFHENKRKKNSTQKDQKTKDIYVSCYHNSVNKITT